MARLIVRAAADAEIDAIAARIAENNLTAALRFYDRVQETYERLLEWPLCGPRARVRIASLQGLRTYPIQGFRNYIIFYLPLKQGIEVVHVLHGARNVRKVLRSGEKG